MKEFWRYTIARLAVFGVCWLGLWLISLLIFEQSSLSNLIVLFVAMVLSALISAFLLASLRDDLARNVQRRAERMSERFEEARSSEDVD